MGDKLFCLGPVLGRGAFGVVRLANYTGGAAAVKEVHAKDPASYKMAGFEAEVLERLTRALPEAARVHTSAYLSHVREPDNTGGGTVKLAMAFVDATAVDQWLYGISDEDHKKVDISQLVDGRLPRGQQASMDAHSAANMVTELLIQCGTVLRYLAPIAFHRDVSSHNSLVRFPHGPQGKPVFCLIDFGLAVKSREWSRDWQTANLAGDPRYWTPGAWMAFTYGFTYLSGHANQGYIAQYLHRMDHFGLGILGLEMLFALWDPSEAYTKSLPGMLQARAAWANYWVNVLRLFQMFHAQGATAVRCHMTNAKADGLFKLQNDLAELIRALHSASITCGDEALSGVLMLLFDCLDERSVTTWDEALNLFLELRRPQSSSSAQAGPRAGAQQGGSGVSTTTGTTVSASSSSTSTCTTSPRRAEPPRTENRAPQRPQGSSVPNRRTQVLRRPTAELQESTRLKLRAMAKTEASPHRRCRSTGGALDSELRRFEPEVRMRHLYTSHGRSTSCSPSAGSSTSARGTPCRVTPSFTHMSRSSSQSLRDPLSRSYSVC